ncbi:MAG: DUF4861 domain-containing protein [Sedimentisphaerales bacterium]
MIKIKTIAVMCIWTPFCLISIAESETVKVTNRLNENRENETISVSLQTVSTLSRFSTAHKPSVFSEFSNQFIPCQLIDNNGDGKNEELIFQANFEPNQTQIFHISDSNESQDVNTPFHTNAMFVPQRKDDFAWENDKIAFRMYGQELQKTELTSSGIDVWVKKVKYPIMLNLYTKGHDYLHSDNPEGVDFYNIGPTLGCGGLGVWSDGKLYRSENYYQWKIIANGPIRSIFELTYKPWQMGNKKVGETKRISLDLGSNLNHIESRFDADVNDVIFAVGIVKCERGGQPYYARDKSQLIYWQNPDANFGIIGCAVILPNGAARNESVDEEKNYLLLAKTNGKNSISYYAGACWNKFSEFESEEKWLKFIAKKA